MINQLVIKGFKSFKEETIDLNQLNILTGLNSSGKSSVILSRYSKRFENPLLEGHGDYKELQNPYSTLPFSIEAKYGKDDMICYSPLDSVTAYADSFPELIFISADRYGPLVSIPLLSVDMLVPTNPTPYDKHLSAR